MLDALAAWLQSTSLSHAIVSVTWIWPVAETIHFIGLALVLGIAGFFDARLMGFFRHIPVRAAHDLMPYAIGGFLLNLVTGLIFFVGHPEQYVHNVAWWFKVGCLALAGLNAAHPSLSTWGAAELDGRPLIPAEAPDSGTGAKRGAGLMKQHSRLTHNLAAL